MERLTREMTFEEEYTFLKKEVKELFDKEDRKSEPPESHSVVRRALRCIKKLVAEVEPYKAYKDLEEQGLLLRLPCKVEDTVYYIKDKKIWDCIVDKVTISRTNGVWFEVKTPKSMPDISAIEYTENAFGKTVFLTQSEAEQKLKEMESD